MGSVASCPTGLKYVIYCPLSFLLVHHVEIVDSAGPNETTPRVARHRVVMFPSLLRNNLISSIETEGEGATIELQ